MKKFYTTVAAAAMAVTIVTQAMPVSVTNVSDVQQRTRSTEITMPTSFGGATMTLSKKIGQQKAPMNNIEDFAGDYTWTVFDLMGESTNLSVGAAKAYVEDASTNTLTFDFGGISSGLGIAMVRGIVDFNTNTISIPNNQFLGNDPADGSKLYFYLKEISEDGSELLDKDENCKEVIGSIEGETITFPVYDVFAFGTPDREDLGWYYLTCINTLSKAENLEEGWEYFCDGTFIDGWMTVAAGDSSWLDPAKYPYTVIVQKYSGMENRYRIINPYSSMDYPFVDVFNAGSGYIIFDISDPDYVMVEPNIPTGILYQQMYDICATNLEGYFYFYYNGQYSTSEIREALLEEDDSLEFSTIEGNTITFKNCLFTIKGNDQLSIWDNEAEPYMHGSLVLEKTPTNSVKEAINENEPVEFYNLQGLRVNSDVKGLVIRRQGAKSEKIYIK